MKRKFLKPCPHCSSHGDEKSVIIKIYSNGRRVEYCINPGCGYHLSLPQVKGESVQMLSQRGVLI